MLPSEFIVRVEADYRRERLRQIARKTSRH
jgi:hypothetical protein